MLFFGLCKEGHGIMNPLRAIKFQQTGRYNVTFTYRENKTDYDHLLEHGIRLVQYDYRQRDSRFGNHVGSFSKVNLMRERYDLLVIEPYPDMLYTSYLSNAKYTVTYYMSNEPSFALRM